MAGSSRIDEAEARLGTRLGNYALKEIIGRGGMGVVYRGQHIYIKKQVAVKVLYRHLFDNPEAKQRFLHEAQAASLIDHPNVVGVTDFGEAPDGTLFLVMTLVEGESMEQLLRREGQLPLFRALSILSQTARALSAAHERSVIHRDLKPENIMLQRRDGRREIVRTVTDQRGTLELVEHEGWFDFVTVLDFGAAKIWDASALDLDEEGVVVATPYYMAPETAQNGYADARSDIYALGVILYRTLTGVLPFDGDTPREIMLKHVNWTPQPPRQCNPNVEITPNAERVVLKALAKDPAHRQQTMQELFADLQRCYGAVRFRRGLNLDPDADGDVRVPTPLLLRERKTSPGAPGAITPAPTRTPTSLPISRTPGPVRGTAPGFAGAPAQHRDAPIPPTPTPATFFQHTPLPLARTPAPLPAASASSPAPILLTRKKSDRHRTLPFGVEPGRPAGTRTAQPGAAEGDGFERHPTHPYALSLAEQAEYERQGKTPAPRRR